MPFEQIPYTNFHGTNQDWMIQQIKQMIADWASYRANLDTAWADYQENINSWRQALDAAFAELHTYVHDYFDNLDVQEEINNKLDQMAEDGTLDQLLLPYFNSYKTEINNTVLTQNNKIATLESRVNNFLDNTGTLGTEKDPELIDIRVSAYGNTYPSAGDAVRGQVDYLIDDIETITKPYVNLFNPLYLQTLALWNRNGDEYYGIINDLDKNFKKNGQFYPGLEFEADTQYTLSFDGKMSGSNTEGTGIQFEYHYSDGTVSYLRVPNSQTEYSHYTFTSTAEKTITMLCVSYGSAGSNIGYIKQIQLEKGSTATTFQNYLVANDKKARDEIESLNAKHATDFDNLNGTLNLSAFTKYTKGYVNDNGSIVYGSNWQYTNEWTSDFIKVNPSVKYTLYYGATVPETASAIPDYNIWGCVAFYDENKDFINRYTYNHMVSLDEFNSYRHSFWTPTNAKYIRVSARHYEDGFIMVYRGEYSAPFLYSSYDIANLIKLNKAVENIVIPDTRNLEKNIALCSGNNIKSINHTGWYEAPENTLPAFKLSKKKGFRYVETDVSFTSDSVPVLLHDNTINRTGRNPDGTTISNTINIYDITYEQALEYDFGIYKGQAYAGTKIPTLEQFILLCRNLGLHPYIEIKSSYDYTRQQVEECFNIVKKYGMKNNVTWISFSAAYLTYIKELDPTAKIGYVVSTVKESSISTAQGLKTATNEVFIDSGSYTDAEINLCINADLPMEVWTIGTTELINSINPYVSGFTSGNLNASQVLYDANIN